MTLENRIEALISLGDYIEQGSGKLNEVITKSRHYNKWFTEENINQSLKAIATNYLKKEKLEQWLSAYSLKNNSKKTVGLVMAGNIPLVGFHDLLAVLISGHAAQVKLSSRDKYLLPHLVDQLIAIAPKFSGQVEFAERLKGFDAVIATGSNNSARYFDYYFGKYPHIIRKNRNSVAILTGEESAEDIQNLGKDIFQYFGLGCRNVSKLYIPRDFDFNTFLQQLEPFDEVMLHDGYKNNYDYNRTLLLMNNTPHYATDFLMLSENEHLSSPIASLYFEYYDSKKDLQSKITNLLSEIQCVVAKNGFKNAIPFGKAQEPELWDYADEVDTVKFLEKL